MSNSKKKKGLRILDYEEGIGGSAKKEGGGSLFLMIFMAFIGLALVVVNLIKLLLLPVEPVLSTLKDIPGIPSGTPLALYVDDFDKLFEYQDDYRNSDIDRLQMKDDFVVVPYGESAMMKIEFAGAQSINGFWHSDSAFVVDEPGVNIIKAEPFGSNNWEYIIATKDGEREFNPCAYIEMRIGESLCHEWITLNVSLGKVSYPYMVNDGTYDENSGTSRAREARIYVISPEEYNIALENAKLTLSNMKLEEIYQKELDEYNEGHDGMVFWIVAGCLLMVIGTLAAISALNTQRGARTDAFGS